MGSVLLEFRHQVTGKWIYFKTARDVLRFAQAFSSPAATIVKCKIRRFASMIFPRTGAYSADWAKYSLTGQTIYLFSGESLYLLHQRLSDDNEKTVCFVPLRIKSGSWNICQGIGVERVNR